MKKIFPLLPALLIALFITANTYSIPLHGTYTIGAGGNYLQISDAVAALDSHGIAGPVTFRITSGIYHGTTFLREVANSNSSNIITFISAAQNPDSVIITDPSEYSFRLEGAKNVELSYLTLQNISMNGNCQNIFISSNKFTDHTIQMIDGEIHGFYVRLNSDLAGVRLSSHDVQMSTVNISYNDFSPLASFIHLVNVYNLTIEVNKNLGNLFLDLINTAEISANKLTTNQPGSNVIQLRESQIVYVKNNFFDCQGDSWGMSFIDNNLLNCLNNTIRNEGLDTTISCIGNSGLQLLNNIYTNDSLGWSLSLWNNTAIQSDFNVYYNGVGTDIIRYNGIPYTLTGFQNASGEDQSSWNYPPVFNDSNDLHLHSSMAGNYLLIGTPLPDVTHDIDGQVRNPLYPFRGADELETPLPVELVSFTSTVSESDVTLSWTTSSEFNNFGFQIERTSGTTHWNTIAFVEGNGNSNSPLNYSYTDHDLNAGNYNYRLKQIDINGNFTYHNLSNEVVIGIPSQYKLSQNYPNPFNPETMISYDLQSEQFMSLKVYDMTGKEVADLVNKIQPAGSYRIKFNAGNISSGVYYMRMEAGDFRDVKKMVVIR